MASILFISVGKAQEGISDAKATNNDGLRGDIAIGFSNLLFDGVSSNGFNIGMALFDLSNTNWMNYGINCSYSGFLKNGSGYQSILSMGPATGIRFCTESGFAFEIGLASGISLVKVLDKDGLPFEGACINGKPIISFGYKNYTINLESCYYTSSKYDFSSFSVNFKCMLNNK
ncbi:MAG: hypothetical protein WCR42_00790 [bacterium]